MARPGLAAALRDRDDIFAMLHAGRLACLGDLRTFIVSVPLSAKEGQPKTPVPVFGTMHFVMATG